MATLGKDTGSLVNYLMMGRNMTKPEVGMGVTFLHWTDRNPGTIVEVKEEKGKLWIATTADDYVRIDDNGFSESQEYSYTSNMDSPHRQHWVYDTTKNRWVHMVKNQDTGRWNKRTENIFVGEREKYHDFSF